MSFVGVELGVEGQEEQMESCSQGDGCEQTWTSGLQSPDC